VDEGNSILQSLNLYFAVFSQVEDFVTDPKVSDANRYFAQQYLKARESNSFITAEQVLSYTKDSYNLVYSADCNPK
jgi:hypothetical protein